MEGNFPSLVGAVMVSYNSPIATLIYQKKVIALPYETEDFHFLFGIRILPHN